MTKAERLAIVQRVCTELWAQRAWLDTDLAADWVVRTPEWAAAGYQSLAPWEHARRYVREHLRALKRQGRVQVETLGSEHYNRWGTMVRYYLVGRTDPQAHCRHCWQVWPEAGLRVVDAEGARLCQDCYEEHRLMEAMDREGEEWMRRHAAEIKAQWGRAEP